MPRRLGLGPLEPIFDEETQYGSIQVPATTPGEPTHQDVTGAIGVDLAALGEVVKAENIEFTEYWDFSNTANWTGALSTGQLPEVGTLAMKQIDVANGMGLGTINGLQCAANTGGFLSARGEWGTDAGLPAVSAPYVLAGVYKMLSLQAAGRGVMACSPTNDPGGSGTTPQINAGATTPATQASASGAAVTLSATTAPGDLNAHAALLVVDGASSELWVDDVLEASGTLGNCDFDSGKRVVIITARTADGAGPNGGAGQTMMSWGEGGLSVGTHPSADAVHAWFASVMTKWGI